ncbi:MAG: sodium:proton antiporter [Deltaproteobacteria bacterium]|nr:sodium:proton antiporter [Candidatus Anaeroferrophillus wilburensis]MBN2888019.1 sodium:proton antiporter [Deltaproteobacteria bacterium]
MSMDTTVFHNPGLTIAFSLALGMMAQALAHHLRVPGIVLLLAAGVLFGPDGMGIIRPETLGSSLTILTGFAVAVILFEGGMKLKFGQLKRVQRSIRQLILFGGLLTVAGGAAAAHYLLHWPWKTAVLFGTLIMVTGPTVINPLLKRLKVKRSVATVLEAEGVLIDAIGAVVATVALEAALTPEHGGPLVWCWDVISRLGFGAVSGGVVALLLVVLYRKRRLIPVGTENVFTLSVMLALFQGANLILPESGIAAVTVAGIVTGNVSSHALRELVEFKEELTVMLIGMLFVLLAADVRLVQVVSLGWPALGVVAILMFLVRPVAVLAGTCCSSLGWKERFFIAWIGPRGIVAAAVASFFAAAFTEQGLSGGYELRALVFLVIAVTVVFSGLTGGPMAGALGLRRPSQLGWVILGANALARGVAKLFMEDGQEIVCIDANADHCQAAEFDCTRVIYGNGLDITYLQRAEIDIRRGALALTANEGVNYLFMQVAKGEVKELLLYTVLKADSTSLTVEMLHQDGAEEAFGMPIDVPAWDRRFAAKQVGLQRWKVSQESPGNSAGEPLLVDYSGNGLLAAAVRRNGELWPVGDSLRVKNGDEVYFFVFAPELQAADEWLTRNGWQLLDTVTGDVFSTSACQLVKSPRDAEQVL